MHSASFDAEDIYQNAFLSLLRKGVLTRKDAVHLGTRMRQQWLQLLLKETFPTDGAAAVPVESVSSDAPDLDTTIHQQRAWWAVAGVLTKSEMESITLIDSKVLTWKQAAARRKAINKARRALGVTNAARDTTEE